MEENRIPEGWERVKRGNIIFDEDGRMKLLGHCQKCGGMIWLKQGRFFKRALTGKCPGCGARIVAKMRKARVSREEVEYDEERIRDVEKLIAHVTDVAVREMDPVLYDAAEMLRELNEKHWSECWQIGVYSDGVESEKEESDE